MWRRTLKSDSVEHEKEEISLEYISNVNYDWLQHFNSSIMSPGNIYLSPFIPNVNELDSSIKGTSWNINWRIQPQLHIVSRKCLHLHRVPLKARMENGICISCWWMPTARFNSDCHTCQSRLRPSITKKITPTGKRSHPTRMVKDCAQNTNAPNYISHNLLQGKGHRAPIKQVWVTSLCQTH